MILPMMKPQDLSDKDHSGPTKYQITFVMTKVIIGLCSVRNHNNANGMIVQDEQGLYAANVMFICVPLEQAAS